MYVWFYHAAVGICIFRNTVKTNYLISSTWMEMFLSRYSFILISYLKTSNNRGMQFIVVVSYMCFCVEKKVCVFLDNLQCLLNCLLRKVRGSFHVVNTRSSMSSLEVTLCYIDVSQINEVWSSSHNCCNSYKFKTYNIVIVCMCTVYWFLADGINLESCYNRNSSSISHHISLYQGSWRYNLPFKIKKTNFKIFDENITHIQTGHAFQCDHPISKML